MDFIWRFGIYFLSLLAVSVMLFFTALGLESIDETESYVAKQNAQDKIANDYAVLAPYDYRAVGAISKQEAINFIFTRTSDLTPVLLVYRTSPPNSTLTYRYFVTTGAGEPVPTRAIGDASIYPPFNLTNISTQKLPSYKALVNLIERNNQNWIVDVDPLLSGDHSLVVVREVF